jgi:hypothetical protein
MVARSTLSKTTRTLPLVCSRSKGANGLLAGDTADAFRTGAVDEHDAAANIKTSPHMPKQIVFFMFG